jgi:general secretion pathway protein N
MKRLVPVLGLAAALLAAVEVRAANPPGALDLPPSNVIPAPVDVAPTAAPRAERPADPTGNPLWAIPLSSLTATRERPIFLPSRRAPAPAVAGTPVVVAPPPPPPAAEPEQPPLILVGAIAGDSEGFAVFLDQATNNVVRLKTGQDHQGWMLRSVKGREATLEKNKRSTTLALPALNADIAAAAPPPPPSMLPRPGGGGMIPRMPGPAGPQPPGAAPGGGRPALGAPKQAIPGDPRPLEDQL